MLTHDNCVRNIPPDAFISTSCAVIFGHVLASWNPKKLGVGYTLQFRLEFMITPRTCLPNKNATNLSVQPLQRSTTR